MCYDATLTLVLLGLHLSAGFKNTFEVDGVESTLICSSCGLSTLYGTAKLSLKNNEKINLKMIAHNYKAYKKIDLDCFYTVITLTFH